MRIFGKERDFEAFEEVIGNETPGDQIESQRQVARLGKARCLAASQKTRGDYVIPENRCTERIGKICCARDSTDMGAAVEPRPEPGW